MMRPHRGSRATSTIGAYVQTMPFAAASMAAMRAERSASGGSQLLASPSGMGKMVRNPWITSSAKSSGTCSRDPSMASRCSARVVSAPMTSMSEPTPPCRISVVRVSPAMPSAESWLSWPSFSSSVIAARSESTNRSSPVARRL
jgi:hypothetical protein